MNEGMSSTLILLMETIFSCNFSLMICVWQVSNYKHSPDTKSPPSTLQELLSQYGLSLLPHTYQAIVTYLLSKLITSTIVILSIAERLIFLKRRTSHVQPYLSSMATQYVLMSVQIFMLSFKTFILQSETSLLGLFSHTDLE